MAISIRNYHSTDRDQVVALWNDVFHQPTGRNDPQRSIDCKVAVEDELFFVAVDQNQVIGTVMAGYDGHRGWLYSVAVAKVQRRDGVGTQLVRHAEQVLKDLGCLKINLQILADNAEVVNFYESLGFRVEERISMGKTLVD